MFLWDQNFYDNKLGKGGPEIINKMHEEGLLSNGESSGYAFALNNGTYKGLKTVSHGGSLAGYRAELVRFPEENFSVIILANRGDANPTAKSYQIADLFLKDRFVVEAQNEVQEKSTSASNVLEVISPDQFAGKYEIQAGVLVDISVEDDSIHVLQSWNNAEYTIVNTTGNTYQIPNDPSIQFVFSELKSDLAQKLTVFQAGNETVCKRRDELDLSALKLEDFIGDYYCEELDANYFIYLDDGLLKVQISNYDPQELTVYGMDSFSADGNLFRFNRSKGSVNGFELDAGRVTDLKFTKK
jgi:hypothetical protein